MLVVKVEVWPGGDADRATEISRIGIANTLDSGDPDVGDYRVVALMERDKQEKVFTGHIVHHRRSNGWELLAERALRALRPWGNRKKRDMHEVPYDDPIAHLLRREPRV